MKKKNKNVFTGGSRIGLGNETFPFSKLIIESQKIILKTTFSGTIEISSKELLAIKVIYYVPFLAQGIKIQHQNPHYKKTLIFWSFKDPKAILKLLEESGLMPVAAPFRPGRENISNPNSVHNKRIKFLTSPLFIAFLGIMLLFLGFLKYKAYHRYDDYTTMGKTSGYQLAVEKISIDHGVAFLNDSIIVPGGTKLISLKPKWFKHNSKPLFGNEYPIPPGFANLKAPFNLIKDPGSFDFKVMKYGDTLIFQIPDPDFKDPRDPSFGDVYDQLFNK